MTKHRDNSIDLVDLMFFRNAFDPKERDAVSRATSISFEGETSMTQQEFAAECDINNIMAKYDAAGVDAADLLQDVLQNGRFGDCTLYDEFHASMNFVAEAGEAFDALPAKLRARFDNDPAKLLRFLDDKENTDEAIRLGLLPAPAPAPLKDEGGVTPPVASKEAPKSPSE